MGAQVAGDLDTEAARALLLGLGLPGPLEVYWVEQDCLDGVLVGYSFGCVTSDDPLIVHTVVMGDTHHLAGQTRGWPVLSAS